jgi:hypothetical protein
MKLINYRGGIARFNLPESWIEEYEPEGGARFFEDKSDSGTLRTHAIDVNAPTSDSSTTASSLIAELSNANATRSLPNGVAIAHTSKAAVENGTSILIYSWNVGIRVSLTHFRIIVFTYTILASQERDPIVRSDVAMLDQSISGGEYPAIRGTSGRYEQ